MKKFTVSHLSLLAPLVLLASCASTLGRSGDAQAYSSAGSGTKKSIRAWVSCTGSSDDTAGVAKAFAAARHGAFTLVVDCPVNLKVGTDIARSIFIDEGTTVEFTEAGKFTVDNVFIPAFVIADSSNITLTDWNVEYDGGLSIDQNVGYTNNGSLVAGSKPANAFNDLRLTPWLAANRAIVFDKRAGNVNSQWTGTTNACAVFFITGDSSDLHVTGMRLYVPKTAGGERFIPVAFSLGVNYRRNQTVNAKMPMTGQIFAVPHDITFSNVTLDGTYMGWVGGLQNALFENIRSERYGDLQDAHGETVGGVKKWFAPPHLFYFNYTASGDAALFNTNIRIKDVIDSGVRVGKARDAGGSDSISGYALSLKIGCVNCSVDNYRSDRPDGFLDVLTSDGLTISNVTATYNSAFLNNVFPGWRFPSATYKNVKFENINFIDTAASSIVPPIGNANQSSNEGIVFKNVRVQLNHWAGAPSVPLPAIAGQAADAELDYSIKSDASRIVRSRRDSMEITFQATPATLRVGTPTVLAWTSKEAKKCRSGGDWSGEIGTSGSRMVNMTSEGSHDFAITCENGTATSQTTLRVFVSP